MSAEAAAGILFRDLISSSDNPISVRAEKINEYRKRICKSICCCIKGYVDDIFEPSETRIRLISALDMHSGKGKSIAQKHGNMPF